MHYHIYAINEVEEYMKDDKIEDARLGESLIEEHKVDAIDLNETEVGKTDDYVDVAAVEYGGAVAVAEKGIVDKYSTSKKQYTKRSAKQPLSVWLRLELKKVNLKNFLFLTIAGVINAAGVILFLTPAGLYDSGMSGTSFLLSQVTPLTLSMFLVILNVPLFIFGFKRMGLPFMLYSVWAVGIYSLFAYLFQHQFGISFDNGSPIVGSDLFLCALCGGLVSGIGSGLTIRFGGAIDGVEVAAVVFAKKIGITVGTFVMIYNAMIYIIAGIVMQSWILPLYSIVTYAVGLKAVDFMVEGLDRAKSAFIISDKFSEVASALSLEFGRGVTLLEAEGYYSKDSKKVIYCVVNRFEIGKLKSIVEKVDPTAFVAIGEVSDSLGSSVRFRRRSQR